MVIFAGMLPWQASRGSEADTAQCDQTDQSIRSIRSKPVCSGDLAPVTALHWSRVRPVRRENNKN